MFSIFGFSIHLYGLIVGSALIVSVKVIQILAKPEGFDKNYVWDGVTWVAIFALVGARLYHVIDLWSYYSTHQREIIAVWQGGIGIFGAIGGGFIGLVLFTRYKRLTRTRLIKSLDLAAIGLPLGQAIARWGNYFNQELYGGPTDLPWKIFIDPSHRIAGYESVSYYHPLFLYESLLNLLLFSLLLSLYKLTVDRRTNKNVLMVRSISTFTIGEGGCAGVYLIGYGGIRFVLEFVRLEKWTAGGVSVAQLMSMGFVIVGVILVYNAMRKENRELSTKDEE